ncbi:MAG: non-canonical purine NTP pyrophosphatase, partial [Bacteroidetes bacterium SW_10_40_5]
GPDADNQANLIKLMHEMSGFTNRKARFKTVLALIFQGKEYSFYGITHGIITESPEGQQGFGYDPVFKPKGYEQTYAEMPLSKKNSISHRGKAVRSLVAFLKRL